MRKMFFVLTCLFCSVAFAQEGNVKGTVLDGEFGSQPLAFAQVKIKGLELEAQTNLEGRYNMQLSPGNYTLVVEFIGYETQEILNFTVASRDEEVDLGALVLKARKRVFDEALASEG